MRILTIGLDVNILDTKSATFKRALRYAAAFDWYEVVVPSRKRTVVTEGNMTIVGSGGGRLKALQLCRLMCYVWRAVTTHHITIISSQDVYFLGCVAVLIGSMKKIGVEIQVHGLEKFTMVRRELADFALRRADSIRVVSKELKKRIHSYFGVDDQKIIVVPIFVDWKEIQYTQFDHRIKEATQGHIIFLAVGRLVPVKNIEGIIRAFYHVHKEYPKTHLLLVGDGPLKPKLMGEVRELGIESVVEFVGWVDTVIEYYRGSHCGIFFSQSEGYGMALIEALACQLPVITTKVGVASEVVEDGVNGLFVDRDDVESLERLMKLIVVNENMRREMKQQTRKSLEKLPTQEAVLAEYKRSWAKAERATSLKRL